MITGAIKNKVDKIWDDIAAGGITNPIIVLIFSCSNCHENLRYALNISIDIDKLYQDTLSRECMVNDYQWKIEDVLVRLGHCALIAKFNE